MRTLSVLLFILSLLYSFIQYLQGIKMYSMYSKKSLYRDVGCLENKNN